MKDTVILIIVLAMLGGFIAQLGDTGCKAKLRRGRDIKNRLIAKLRGRSR